MAVIVIVIVIQIRGALMKYLKRETSRVYIMLGNQCNMSCTYCLQHPLINKQIVSEINPEIYDFLCEAAYENKEHRLRIMFYGGEPLLYFENIKAVVTALNQRNGVDFEYAVISNGKAMTDEMVKFFNDNKISVTISWDGDKVLETRGIDVFADVELAARLLKINNLCLSGVISARAYPKELLEAMQILSNRYYGVHGYHIGVNLDEIFDTGIANKDLLALNYDRVHDEMAEIMSTVDPYLDDANICKASDGTKITYIYGLVQRIMKSNGLGCTVYCGNGLSVLNLDLQGNLYPCHNTSEKAGTIKDSFYRYLDAVLTTDNTKLHKDECASCEVVALCRGGCKLVKPNARKSGYCKLKQAMFVPVLSYIEKIGLAKKGV